MDIVRIKLNNIKTDKSAGPDDILPRVLFECREELVEPLYILFSSSIEQGKLPAQWKQATVVPIFKKGSKKNPSNYRPISLTSVLCKCKHKQNTYNCGYNFYGIFVRSRDIRYKP